jgi:Skp family chaperone for outer membrane proteins
VADTSHSGSGLGWRRGRLRNIDRGRRPFCFQENRTVKRTAFLLAGAALLGAAIYVGTLWANPPGRSAPQTTKVGLVNITYVMKYYYKYQAYTDDLKASMAKFQTNDTDWRKKGEALTKERADTKTTEARKEGIDRELKSLERQLEDNKNEAQKLLIKKNEEQMKLLYKDVRDKVAVYAEANGFDLIFHYHEPLDKVEFDSSQNIARKLNVGALVPMYWSSGLDISREIVMSLNQNAPRPAKAAGGK